MCHNRRWKGKWKEKERKENKRNGEKLLGKQMKGDKEKVRIHGDEFTLRERRERGRKWMDIGEEE